MKIDVTKGDPSRADGERRLTNVNHLAELVQARAATQPGIAPTLHWLAAQRTQGFDTQGRLVEQGQQEASDLV